MLKPSHHGRGCVFCVKCEAIQHSSQSSLLDSAPLQRSRVVVPAPAWYERQTQVSVFKPSTLTLSGRRALRRTTCGSMSSDGAESLRRLNCFCRMSISTSIWLTYSPRRQSTKAWLDLKMALSGYPPPTCSNSPSLALRNENNHHWSRS